MRSPAGPLGVTTLSRGLALLQEPAKAQALEFSGRVLQSERLQFDVPSVIALHKYRKFNGNKFNGERAAGTPSRDECAAPPCARCLGTRRLSGYGFGHVRGLD